jgi:hypothetical protein
LEGEIEALADDLPHCCFVDHKSHMNLTWNLTVAAAAAVGTRSCDFSVMRIVLGYEKVSYRQFTTFIHSSECK